MDTRTRVISRLVVTVAGAAIALGLLTPTSAAYGQEAYIELLRSDVRTQKVAIITEVMQFSDEDAAIFWPVFREYDVKLAALGDMRLKMIKEYAAAYGSITDEQARGLADQYFAWSWKRTDLRKEYYNKVQSELSSTVAAKFIQLEHQIGLLIDLQVASELPLIQ